MKNLKNVFLALMVGFLVIGFISCDQPTGSPKTEVENESGEDTGNDSNENEENETPINNFKDKTFIGMIDEGDDEESFSYIIFTSDTECKVMFSEVLAQATYTVTNDVATISGTGEFAQIQLSTTKLTNGEFSITIPPKVSGEKEDIIVNYAVGTLWTISYPSEDFSIEMPEQLLASAIKKYEFEDADYTKDDATKTVTLTDSGWEKVMSAMGGGSEEDSGEGSGEIYWYMYNGELAGGKNTLEDFYYEVEIYGLVESEDYTIDYENKQINFTKSGYNKIN